jgi:hypothetical protein
MYTRPKLSTVFDPIRRGGRVVDGTGLENRHTRKGIGGSNPSLSAITFCFCYLRTQLPTDSQIRAILLPALWRSINFRTKCGNYPDLDTSLLILWHLGNTLFDNGALSVGSLDNHRLSFLYLRSSPFTPDVQRFRKNGYRPPTR